MDLGQLLPVPAAGEDSVPWTVLLSVDVTAAVRPRDTRPVLEPEPVRHRAAIISTGSSGPHTPGSESREDTGTLGCSSCGAPW